MSGGDDPRHADPERFAGRQDGYKPGPKPSQRDGEAKVSHAGGSAGLYHYVELMGIAMSEDGSNIVNDPIINDPVNPKHYRGDLVMRILETFGLDENFNLGNLIKYILREGEKAGLEDLKKGRWYLEREIAKREGKLPEKLT